MSSLFNSKQERYTLGKYVANILREIGPNLGLVLDKYGWANLDDLIQLIRKHYTNIDKEYIKEIVDKDAQKRFQLEGNHIRAKTGHKYNVEMPTNPIKPPDILYHGTSKITVNKIFQQGILKMGKSYVHLSSTIDRAYHVGLRKSQKPIVLSIEATKAYNQGVRFWRSGQISPDGEIYLSDEIPPDCLIRSSF